MYIYDFKKKFEYDENRVYTKSGIKRKKFAIEIAYDQYTPSLFIRDLAIAIWGYKELAKRFTRRDKNTPADHRSLEKKWKRVVKEHFRYLLFRLQKTHSEYIKEMDMVNTYFHRAIVHCQKILPQLTAHPEDFEDSDTSEEEI